MASKSALVLGMCDYDDVQLARLHAPSSDVKALAKVLKDEALGGFEEVTEYTDEGRSVVEVAITQLFADKQQDDLVVLYFSGHGLKDDEGDLYLAVKDTKCRNLLGTAVAAEFIKRVMNKSNSRRQVLILDCCHSGAFSAGFKGASADGIGANVGTKTAFDPDGFGRIILTASDATQYAWEGENFKGEAQTSLYTGFLIEGIRSGAADLSRDGMITVNELHDYVYKKTVQSTSKQRPTKICDHEKGNLILSRAPLHAAALPEEVTSALRSPFASVRQAMVGNLAEMFRHEPAGMAISAYRALATMTEDDSKAVRQAAEEAIAVCRSQRMEIDRSLLEAIKLEAAGKTVETPGELEALQKKQEENTLKAQRIYAEIAASAEANKARMASQAESFRKLMVLDAGKTVMPGDVRGPFNNMDAYIRTDEAAGAGAAVSDGKTIEVPHTVQAEVKRLQDEVVAAAERNREAAAQAQKQVEGERKREAAGAEANEKARFKAREIEELAEKRREIERISRENALKKPEAQPWWRRWWAIGLGGLTLVLALRSCGTCASSNPPAPATSSSTATAPAAGKTGGTLSGEATVGALVFDPPSNIRDLPTASSAIVCTVTSKQSITVYATPLKTGEGTWWKNEVCGRTGFIAGNQVHVDGEKY